MHRTHNLSIAVIVIIVATAGFPDFTAPGLAADLSCSSAEKMVFDFAANSNAAGYISSIVQVGEAKLNYLQAQLACKEISKRAYCKAAVDLASKDADKAFGETQSGTRNPLELIPLQKELREIKSFCSTGGP